MCGNHWIGVFPLLIYMSRTDSQVKAGAKESVNSTTTKVLQYLHSIIFIFLNDAGYTQEF